MSVLNILAADKSMIAYRPALNKQTGSVLATILLQQIIFRWSHNQRKEFYKYKEPCAARHYRIGDSWTEELGFTRREFDSALKSLVDLEAVKTRVDIERKTWYTLNEEKTLSIINLAYLETQNDVKAELYDSKGENVPYEKAETYFTNGRNTPFVLYPKNTTEITTKIDSKEAAACDKNGGDMLESQQPLISENDKFEDKTSNLPTLINGFKDKEEIQGQSQTVKTPIKKEKSCAKKESAATVVKNHLTGELIPVTESLQIALWAFVQSDGYWIANKSCKTPTAALKLAITTAQRPRGLMAQFFKHQASTQQSAQNTPHPTRMSKTLGSMWKLQCEMED